MLTTNYYNDFFEFGQQKINFSFFELSLPDDDPVYTLKKVMEELDFSGLLANCSDKGRTGYNPIMMYAVVTYANMRGIRSVDRIVDLCERDLAFIWLTRGQKPKRDAFYDFKNRKLTSDVLDDLNYQFMRRLQKEGLVTLKELFIDGTKQMRTVILLYGAEASITIWQDFWTLSTSFLKNIILFCRRMIMEQSTSWEMHRCL